MCPIFSFFNLPGVEDFIWIVPTNADFSYIWEAFWDSSSVLYAVMLPINATQVQGVDQQNGPHPSLLEMQNCRPAPRPIELESAFLSRSPGDSSTNVWVALL